MTKVSASSSIEVAASAEKTLESVTDYAGVRPRILPGQYRGYQVIEGGRGSGTIAEWTLQATRSRSRRIRATVTVDGSTVTERDANSTLVTVWSVASAGSGSQVTITTEWSGAGGIGGFFEKTFAPLGLRKIQQQVLVNLKKELG